jgi:hypothetical protein
VKLSDRNAPWARTWRRRPLRARALLAVLAAAGMASVFAAGPASAAPDPPPTPASGAAPGTAVVGTSTVLAYLDTTGSAWVVNLSTSAFISAGAPPGGLQAGPALVTSGSSVIVFGPGGNSELYMATCGISAGSTCSAWTSLGGAITSKAGAVFRGPDAADYSVYARGKDGAVWGRDHTSAGWGPWSTTDSTASLYPGTGPSAAFISGHVWLLVTGGSGAAGQLYIQEVGVTRFELVGGLSTATPALTTITGSLVGFARGTDNVAYYHRFQSGATAGWTMFGGTFSSGLAASSNGTTTTHVFGTGANSEVYGNTGTWTTAPATPPAFTGWTAVIT